MRAFFEHPVPLRRVQVDEIAEPAYIVDPDGIVATWNEAAAALFGRPAADVIGAACAQVVDAHSLQGQPLCGIACPLVHPRSRHEPADEVMVQGRFGSPMWALLQHVPMEDVFGRNAGLLHIITLVAEHTSTTRLTAPILTSDAST